MSSLNNPPSKSVSRLWSLRSALLVSHAGLVGVSFLVFGTLLFVTSAHATYRRAEADLLAVAQELVQRLPDKMSFFQPSIPDLYRHRFGMAPRDHAYIVIWDQHGNRVYATPELPQHVQPSPTLPPTSGPHPFHTRATGRNFEVIVATPDNGLLLIGCPLAKEWDALLWLVFRTFTLGTLCVTGSFLIAVWLARRLSQSATERARSKTVTLAT